MFEEQLSEFTGAPYVVPTDSCTNALFLCLVHLKSNNKGSNVVTIPKRTYISVAQSILHAGYCLRFKDQGWVGSYKLDGVPIEDCAVGFRKNIYNHESSDPDTDRMMCISFQQKKALPIGRGGAILLNNKKDYEVLKRLAWDGRDSSIPVNEDKGIILGYHMNMIPDDAARGILLLNNYSEDKIGSYLDYPDISEHFK